MKTTVTREDYLSIRKLSYLKTPLWDWTLRTKEGGSFSNSGQHRTLKSCLKHFASSRTDIADMTVLVTEYYGWDDKELLVKSSYQTYFFKLLH